MARGTPAYGELGWKIVEIAVFEVKRTVNLLSGNIQSKNVGYFMSTRACQNWSKVCNREVGMQPALPRTFKSATDDSMLFPPTANDSATTFQV